MKTLIISLLLLSQLNGYGQDCKGLPSKFSSSSEGINRVKNSTFILTDKLPEAKTGNIVSANYYSCDGEVGYMIYVVGKRARPFIHTGVPKNIWQEFKNAASGEAYYDSNIRDKYKIELKETKL